MITGEKTEGKFLNFLKSRNFSKFFPSHIRNIKSKLSKKIGGGCYDALKIYGAPKLCKVNVVKSSKL